MDSDSINGRTEVYTLVNSRMDASMAKESGRRSKMYQIAITMKVNTKMTRKMDMGSFIGKVGMFTKETTRMMKETDMVRCSGLTVLNIKENGKKGFNMELVR